MRRPLFWAISILMLSLALPAAASAKRNLYFAGTSELVRTFDIAADGNLTPVGTPISTGVGTATPTGASMTPDGRFLFLANNGSDDVTAFSVSADGALTPVPGSPFPTTAEQLLGTAVAPEGDRLYVGDRGLPAPGGSDEGRIFGFQIASDGALTALPGSPYPAEFASQAPAIAPDGKHLYLGSNGGQVQIFAINADGSLTPLNPPPPGTLLRTLSFTPDGAHVYGSVLTTDLVLGFSVAGDGSLTAVPGAPGALADGPLITQVSPDGRRVYAGTIITAGAVPDGRVGGFAIADDGSLSSVPNSPVTPAPSGEIRSLALTPTGALYAGNAQSAATSLSEFGVAGSGELAVLPGSPFDAGVGSASTLGAVVTPNQGPTAVASFTSTPSTREISFNGSGSTDSDGSVANFLWDFGDGGTQDGANPAATHTYAQPGIFKASLTVTDNEGCSDDFVFTGQTASCNGGSKGKTELTIDLQPPVITISGKRSQKLKKRVLVRATCDEKCTITGRGKIGKAKILKLTRELDAGTSRAFKLKLTGKARKKASQIIRGGRKARAKLSFSATDGAGNTGTARRTVKLK